MRTQEPDGERIDTSRPIQTFQASALRGGKFTKIRQLDFQSSRNNGPRAEGLKLGDVGGRQISTRRGFYPNLTPQCRR